MQNAAMNLWGSGPPYTGEVTVTITYFFNGASLDVDNMAKLVLDALKGLVYADDSLVMDLLCRKRDLNHNLRVQSASATLLQRLARPGQFHHIVVESV